MPHAPVAVPDVTLNEELARGSGGVLYSAARGPLACVVRVPPPGATPQQMAAFEADALVLARIGVAGLPRVLLVGRTDRGPYLVLAQSDGTTLADWVAGRPATGDALAVVERICGQLAALHRNGLQHGGLGRGSVRVSGSREVQLLDQGEIVAISDGPTGAAMLRADLTGLGAVCQSCADAVVARGELEPGVLADLADLGGRLRDGVIHSAQAARAECGRLRMRLPGARTGGGERDGRRPRQRREFDSLRNAFLAAQQREGVIVEVLGPAGSGKSHLVTALAQEIAKRGCDVLQVKCRDDEWLPFSALQRLLDTHVAAVGAMPDAERTEASNRLRRAAADAAPLVGLLSPRLQRFFGDEAPRAGDADLQEAFIEQLAGFLRRYLALLQSPLLVVEDVHWIDASSRRVLARMAGGPQQRGTMLLYTSRNGDDESRAGADRMRRAFPTGQTQRVELGPLPRDTVAGLVETYLGMHRPASDGLLDAATELSDGTPLGILELLRITVARGDLRPRWGTWQLDAAAVRRMNLPSTGQGFARRRLGELDPQTHSVLVAGAVHGHLGDEALLGSVAGCALGVVREALRLAERWGLLRNDELEGYLFVHDSVWEALLGSMSESARRAMHMRVAAAMEAQGGQGVEYDCLLAAHYARGDASCDPRRAYDVCLRAAEHALLRYDDAQARLFLLAAERSAARAGTAVPTDVQLELAEVCLRLGASAESLAAFEGALRGCNDPVERCHIWTRIAWVKQHEADAEGVWPMLEAAFREVDETPVDGGGLGMAAAAARLAAEGLVPVAVRSMNSLSPEDTRRLEVRCQLLYQCVRFSADNGQHLRLVQAVLQLAREARGLGPSVTLVHALTLLAFVLQIFGMRRPGERHVQRAKQMAAHLDNPHALAVCAQVEHVIAGWTGASADCERLGIEGLDAYGAYMEMVEYCGVAFGVMAIRILRGLPVEALAIGERAIDRVAESGHGPPQFWCVEEAARAQLHSLDRGRDIETLNDRLSFLVRRRPQPGSYIYQWFFQCKVQVVLETGCNGEEIDALVAEFDSYGVDPKQAHIIVSLYYIQLGHARLQQCLRAAPGDVAKPLAGLQAAARDAAATARVNLLKTHVTLLDAAQRFFAGDVDAAFAGLAEAESIARIEHCPWVLYAAARVRAHILRGQGHAEAALSQARVALGLAREACHVPRQRWIVEEFPALGAAPRATNDAGDAAGGETSRIRQHLDALLHISRAHSGELSPERQAREVLAELVRSLSAERGFLLLRGVDGRQLQVRAAHDRGAPDLAIDLSERYDRGIVDRAYATGRLVIAHVGLGTGGAYGSGPDTARSVLAAPLLLRDEVVGVAYLDCAMSRGSFTAEDGDVLQALANQVPVALELARSLQERERLGRELQHAQKMEAIGRVAGGIAHDFNSILSAIQLSASVLQRGPEVVDILDATEHGASLARQLLTFSRREVRAPEPCDLHAIVRGLLPMLRRLVGEAIVIETALDAELPTVLGDQSQFEQVVLNLVANARDAMGGGGHIRIATGSFDVEDDRNPGLAEGHYCLLSVTDDGAGMSDEVRARLFEPLFSTKPADEGTGLGLATVYGVVQQAAGRIEVESAPGEGSTFRVYLPVCGVQLRSTDAAAPGPREDPARAAGAEHAPSDCTALIVDDDAILRRAMVRALEAKGMHVLATADAVEALTLLRQYPGPVDLMVSDVRMPEMGGAELVAAIPEARREMRVLLVSGDSTDAALRKQLRAGRVEYLHKPFDTEAFSQRVDALLGARAEAARVSPA